MNIKSPVHTGRHPRHLSLRIALAGLFLSLLFTGCATNQIPADAAGKDQSHAELISLREGDSLSIAFPTSPNLNTTQQIRRDGKISLPLVGDVDAAGMTIDKLHDKLVDLYATQVSSSKDLTVSLASSAFPVFVNGAVLHPGKVLSDHPLTVLDAIMEAGGPDFSTANLKSVKVIRNVNGVMKNTRINVQAIFDGKVVTPYYLEPQDIVFVPQRFVWY
jgi:polysaccharide export outer membrane protein